MNSPIELVSIASMQIHQYAADTLTSLKTRGRVLPYYVMSYIQRGQAILRMDDEEYALGPHSVVLIPPFTRHDHVKEDDTPTVFFWWHFDYKIFDTIDMIRLLDLPVVFQLEENASFENAFTRYSDSMEKGLSLKNAMLQKAYAIEVMALLLEAAEKSAPVDVKPRIPDLFREILGYILSEKSEEVTLKKLAARFALHLTYLSNRFSLYFGISPIALYRKLRLERAKNLLSSSPMTVGEVSETLGFSDPAVFSRFFTAKMGVSPSRLGRGSGQ